MVASPIEERAAVADVEHLGSDCVLLRLRSPRLAQAAQPGQFVMVRLRTGFDPLLRRPLGILRRQCDHVELYFQVRGRGTAQLAQCTPGYGLDLLGPLGGPFPAFSGKRILLLAGGRGIVPLFFYASVHARENRMMLIYGGKGRNEMHLLDEIAGLGLVKTDVRSEDGSLGRQGLATDGLEEAVKTERIQVTFSCGPEGMLRAASQKLAALGTENHVSMEAHMGCGFGICHSCVVQARDGRYLKVCTEGPAFRMEELQWQT